MDWDRIEGNWKQFKGLAKQKWGAPLEGDSPAPEARAPAGGHAQKPFTTPGENVKPIFSWESNSRF